MFRMQASTCGPPPRLSPRRLVTEQRSRWEVVSSRRPTERGMVTWPTVSFVVPCYGLAHLLPECVHSILRQSYRDFEVLIMDDCSPDDTATVAKSFRDERVRHIRNEANIGHLRNYNTGISLARGR